MWHLPEPFCVTCGTHGEWEPKRQPREPWGPGTIGSPINGSFRVNKLEKLVKKLKNREFRKPYIKVVRDSCLWDSGRWEWWEIIPELIPPYYRDI